MMNVTTEKGTFVLPADVEAQGGKVADKYIKDWTPEFEKKRLAAVKAAGKKAEKTPKDTGTEKPTTP